MRLQGPILYASDIEGHVIRSNHTGNLPGLSRSQHAESHLLTLQNVPSAHGCSPCC